MGLEIAPGGAEVIRADMGRPSSVVGERFNEHVHVRVVEAAGPVEPEAARLSAGRFRERTGDRGPFLGVLGADAESRGNEDQRTSSLVVQGTKMARPRTRP